MAVDNPAKPPTITDVLAENEKLKQKVQKLRVEVEMWKSSTLEIRNGLIAEFEELEKKGMVAMSHVPQGDVKEGNKGRKVSPDGKGLPETGNTGE